MVIADFQIANKVGKLRFFQKTFLIANTKFEMIIKIFFLKIRNANILFNKETLIWIFYTTNKALHHTKQVQIVNLKEFIIAAFDASNKMFMAHITIIK